MGAIGDHDPDGMELEQNMTRIALAIHGGCGVMPEDSMTPEEWEGARHDLAAALRAGHALLKAGARAVDAVEAAVVVMEDSPHFNAGHGAALNENGLHELDASIMDGATLEAGAISASQAIRNPIKAARALMEDGRAVFLTGPAADRFAEAKGLDVRPQSYFTKQKQVAALAAMKAHAAEGTGKGEFFIRYVVGHEIASRVAYLKQDLASATDGVVNRDLAPYHIGAGLVAIDTAGEIVAPYNTLGMFRGWVTPEGRAFVATHEKIYEVTR
jgi:beta-aspartyl-peptidase (threonine type)